VFLFYEVLKICKGLFQKQFPHDKESKSEHEDSDDEVDIVPMDFLVFFELSNIFHS
jgi:hypothetical protein